MMNEKDLAQGLAHGKCSTLGAGRSGCSGMALEAAKGALERGPGQGHVGKCPLLAPRPLPSSLAALS